MVRHSFPKITTIYRMQSLIVVQLYLIIYYLALLKVYEYSIKTIISISRWSWCCCFVPDSRQCRSVAVQHNQRPLSGLYIYQSYREQQQSRRHQMANVLGHVCDFLAAGILFRILVPVHTVLLSIEGEYISQND